MIRRLSACSFGGWLRPVVHGVVGVLAALVAACGGSPAAPPPAGPPEVGVVTVQQERVVLSTELPGRTSPYLVAEVRPQVNGIIQKRAFNEGSEVKAGALLYQIDPAPYQAAYEQAKAAVVVAETNVPALRTRAERLKGLADINAVGKQDYDDAVAALARAEANVAASKAAAEAARINLGYTPLKSPISGRIGRSNVTVGALVTAYQPVPLAVVQQLDPIYVDVTQATADILRLTTQEQKGHLESRGARKVRLLLEDGTQYPLEGTLQFRDVSVDQATGSVILRMVFPNPSRTLLPGMFVRAIVQEGENPAAILAPQQAVTRTPRGEPTVLVVDGNNRVEQRVLQVDRAIGSNWLVTKGLAPGDRVIVEGSQKVRPGAPVRAVPVPAAPVAPAVKTAADAK